MHLTRSGKCLRLRGKDEERTKPVMELNKETEIYLQTTMLETVLVVMKLNGWGRVGAGLTFTNIVIIGQFPILNLSTGWLKNKPCQIITITITTKMAQNNMKSIF